MTKERKMNKAIQRIRLAQGWNDARATLCDLAWTGKVWVKSKVDSYASLFKNIAEDYMCEGEGNCYYLEGISWCSELIYENVVEKNIKSYVINPAEMTLLLERYEKHPSDIDYECKFCNKQTDVVQYAVGVLIFDQQFCSKACAFSYLDHAVTGLRANREYSNELHLLTIDSSSTFLRYEPISWTQSLQDSLRDEEIVPDFIVKKRGTS